MTDQVEHRAYKRDRTATQKHDDASRMFALSVYAETLSVTEAERASGIAKTTIHGWLQQEDTDSALEQLRTALRSQLAHKYAQIAAEAAIQLIDRLQFGDEAVDSQGNIVRVKVKARDLAAVSAMAVDRHALLTGTSAAHGKANSALAQVMARLDEALAAARKPPKNEATDTPDPVDNAK